MTRVAVLALVILLFTGHGSEAQATASRGRARVVGTVRDSSTGRPIVRTWICGLVDLGPPDGRVTRCATPDTAGHYVLDSLAAGTQILTASCWRLGVNQLVQDTLRVAAGEEGRFDIRTSVRCDMRPFILRRGVFEGRYTSGFEESSFRPCNDSIRAWAEISRNAIESGPKWPAIKASYNPTYFVRWRGTLRGPWQYGHMGVSDYEIIVDSILTVRRPRRSDCR